MAQRDIDRVIIGCKKGDEACFTQLVDIYGRRCFGYFYRLTGNRDLSEELLSELFVKLVEKIGTYRGGSFDGWLFTMASNIFHDHLRFKQRQTRLLDEHSQTDKVAIGGCRKRIRRRRRQAANGAGRIGQRRAGTGNDEILLADVVQGNRGIEAGADRDDIIEGAPRIKEIAGVDGITIYE